MFELVSTTSSINSLCSVGNPAIGVEFESAQSTERSSSAPVLASMTSAVMILLSLAAAAVNTACCCADIGVPKNRTTIEKSLGGGAVVSLQDSPSPIAA